MVTAIVHALAQQLGMTLFGRAANRHFICYTGFERFDAEPDVLPTAPASPDAGPRNTRRGVRRPGPE